MRLSRPPNGAGPIDGAAFAAAMDAFAPFESSVRLAVAVSGGPDSMALVLLLDAWARARGGSIVALTIDHGLRPDSKDEAQQVGAWLAARAVEHAILPWDGEKPVSGIQEAARRARYDLLAGACAERGILHLAVAHHADDQAETVLFRSQRGSGPGGLAGMSACRSLGPARLIRPLLAWPKQALIATCKTAGQDFVEDPSNHSPRFARTALRDRLADDSEQRDTLLATARRAGEQRAADESRLAAILGRFAESRPDGSVAIDLDAMSAESRPPALSAALRAAGGGAHPPDREAVADLDRAATSAGFKGASLAGCLVRPWRGRLLIAREPGRTAPPTKLVPGRWQKWDGRFLLRIAPSMARSREFEVGALGHAGYAPLRRSVRIGPPSLAAATLPAISADGRLVAVPGLGWAEAGAPEVEQRFTPLWPLAPERFTVVYSDGRIICHDVDARPAVDCRS